MRRTMHNSPTISLAIVDFEVVNREAVGDFLGKEDGRSNLFFTMREEGFLETASPCLLTCTTASNELNE
jgi:hypothetical protein